MTRLSVTVFACCVGLGLPSVGLRAEPPQWKSSRSRQAAGEGVWPSAVGGRLSQDTLCGRVLARPPIITASGVGPVRLDMTVDDVRRLCPEAVDTIDETESSPALRLRAFGSLILLATDDIGAGGRRPPTGPIVAIRIEGGSLTTRERVGPGSTLGRLRRVLGRPNFVMCGARPLLVRFNSRPGFNYLFSPVASCPEPRETPPDAPVPDSTRVTAVEVYVER